jgi:hypothetical protein
LDYTFSGGVAGRQRSGFIRIADLPIRVIATRRQKRKKNSDRDNRDSIKDFFYERPLKTRRTWMRAGNLVQRARL